MAARTGYVLRFAKTPMQTSRGVAQVAHEKSLRECAPGGPPPGDRKYQPGSALAQRLSQAAWQCQTEGTARRWSAKGEQTFVDQCRRAALGRKQKFELRHYRLSEGCSRSTWLWRRKARGSGKHWRPWPPEAKLCLSAEAFAAALARDLDRCAGIHAVIARELALPTVNLI